MEVLEKLRILGESAKYDASCATSGVARKNVGRMGNATCAGLCHSWSADGRCISLLKVLLSNDCVYDCQYCVNRRSVDVERATFEPEELADLAMGFYRRNYIEGLFLSSAVVKSPDHTAEKMLRCLQLLREVHGFAGYIHAKIIPGVSPELVRALGFLADRLSVNMELPSEKSLELLAPQKKAKNIFTPMGQITDSIANRKELSAGSGKKMLESSAEYLKPKETLDPEGEYPLVVRDGRKKYKEPFAPAGQSTQMIIGASPETDRQIIRLSESLYKKFRLKRVYFSAYIPVSDSALLP
ncbi:MAG: putative DNA modification/repair radical SAM protein, partial [Clostridiales bacterium]|nr:putative DNA modification/repair radical SAM protein [Clostridiales bacterium]